MVDGRHLALAEQIVERGVDLGLVESEPRGRVVIDHQARLQPLVLGVGVDVGELRQLAHHAPHPRLPDAQVGDGVCLQRVLVLRAGGAAADPDVLNRLQIQIRTRLMPELAAQPRDHLIRADAALGARLERDEHVGAVALAAAGESHHRGDRRIVQHDVDEVAQLLPHRLKGDRLVGLDLAHHQPGVLLREKALGHVDVEVQVERHGDRQDQHHRRAVRQRPVERAAVAVLHGVEGALAQAMEASVRARPSVLLREARAHHRGRGERYDERHQDCGGQRDREFPEQPPDHPAHQQDRDEDRDQRQAHRNHREAHLARALEGRLEPRHAGFHVARDVLEHHHRVVDHETGRDGECHEGEVVEAEAGEIHDCESADERHRHGNERHHGGARAAQEHEDREHHQRHRDHERPLDVAQRRPDRRGAVHVDIERDARRDRGAQVRQERAHPVDGVDDVGARLAEQDQHHGGIAVRESVVAQVLHRVRHLRDIAETHRGAVVIADDERDVFARAHGLVVVLDLPALVARLERALGAVGVGGGDRRAHRLGVDPVAVHRGEVELDAHRGEGAPADSDVADALHLQQLLREHGGRPVVHLAAGERLGGEPEDHDGRVRRVHLAVVGIARERRRQQRARGVDRRLHVARRAVDVAAQVELERDVRRAERARGGHLGDRGDAPERALERGGHRGGHGLGARAREPGVHRDGREVHLRERRHRQVQERRDAGEHHAEGEERRGDRALDEGAREVHAASGAAEPRRRARPLSRRRASRSKYR